MISYTVFNDMSPQVHQEAKKRKEWRNLLKGSGSSYTNKLARKVDLLTESLVFAMKARRERQVVTHGDSYVPSDGGSRQDNLLGGYFYKYEAQLAIASVRALDLLGFYKVSVEDRPYNKKPSVESLFRSAVLMSSSLADDIGNDVGNIINMSLQAIIHKILLIADKDGMDLMWHIEAIRKDLKKGGNYGEE